MCFLRILRAPCRPDCCAYELPSSNMCLGARVQVFVICVAVNYASAGDFKRAGLSRLLVWPHGSGWKEAVLVSFTNHKRFLATLRAVQLSSRQRNSPDALAVSMGDRSDRELSPQARPLDIFRLRTARCINCDSYRGHLVSHRLLHHITHTRTYERRVILRPRLPSTPMDQHSCKLHVCTQPGSLCLSCAALFHSCVERGGLWNDLHHLCRAPCHQRIRTVHFAAAAVGLDASPNNSSVHAHAGQSSSRSAP